MWVFTIMKNIFINNYRRRVSEALPSPTPTEDLIISTFPGILDSPLRKEVSAVKEISAAIKNFTDDYRIPFTMYVRLDINT